VGRAYWRPSTQDASAAFWPRPERPLVVVYRGSAAGSSIRYRRASLPAALRSVVPRTAQGNEKRSVFPAKTLRDWMQLLVVPFALAAGAYWLNRVQSERERRAQERKVNESFVSRTTDRRMRR
jgi:hypothetical protein